MTRDRALRAVLVLYAVGHLVTATEFLFWPEFFITGGGRRPPWPFSLVENLGAWPPVHQGFMNVIAVYDVAVAFALLLAARSPARHTGLLWFAGVLWTLHGAVHAYHIVWGSSPGAYWVTVAELWAGAALLAVLRPKAGQRAPAVEPS